MTQARTLIIKYDWPETSQPDKIVVTMTVNTWLSKTKCSHIDCGLYIRNLRLKALAARKALELLVHWLRSVWLKEEKVKEWHHYCGWEPRYWNIKIEFEPKEEKVKATFHGGNVWHAEIEATKWPGFIHSRGVLRTDGCISREMLAEVLEGLIALADTGDICKAGKAIDYYACHQ